MESEESLKGLEENLKCINAEMQMLEAEYEKQLNDHSEVSFSFWSYFNLVNIFYNSRICIALYLGQQGAWEFEKEENSCGSYYRRV